MSRFHQTINSRVYTASPAGPIQALESLQRGAIETASRSRRNANRPLPFCGIIPCHLRWHSSNRFPSGHCPLTFSELAGRQPHHEASEEGCEIPRTLMKQNCNITAGCTASMTDFVRDSANVRNCDSPSFRSNAYATKKTRSTKMGSHNHLCGGNTHREWLGTEGRWNW